MYVFFGWKKKRYAQTIWQQHTSVYKGRERHGGVPTHTITQSVYGAELNFLA